MADSVKGIEYEAATYIGKLRPSGAMHNTKKKALYEVIIRAKSKTGYEQLHPKSETTEAVEQSSPDEASPRVVRWVNKPRIVQFNAGRIEFSIPFQVGIAVVLGAILVVLLAFRLGQNFSGKETPNSTAVKAAVKEPAPKLTVNKPIVKDTTDARPAVNRPAVKDTTDAKPAVNKPALKETTVAKPAPAVTTPDANRQTAAVGPAQQASTPSTSSGQAGKNRIVIQTYQVKSHLEPAKTYFDKLGVATEIIEKDNWYYLVTKNKYDSIDKPGSSGYLARQKIIELGAGYKAPPGHETFGPKPFSDAFGMKFDE